MWDGLDQQKWGRDLLYVSIESLLHIKEGGINYYVFIFVGELYAYL